MMQTHRIKRLMHLVCEVKHGPKIGPGRLAKCLGVSRRQYFKDRDKLLELGFGLDYSRKGSGVELTGQARCAATGLAYSQAWALMEGAAALARMRDTALALEALDAATALIDSMEAKAREPLSAALNELVCREAFGARPEVLAVVREALAGGTRLVLTMAGPDAMRVNLMPKRLVLKDGLCLEAEGMGLIELASVSAAELTPFAVGV